MTTATAPATTAKKPRGHNAGISPAMRRTKGEKVFTVVNVLLLTLFALICTYPFYYLIINSLSNNQAAAAGEVNWWIQGLHWDNYKTVLGLDGLGRAAWISVARTVIGTVLTVLASAYLGFMFTQQKMWKRSFWYRFVVITMYFNAGLIPMFITMKNYGLTNNFWVYVLPAIVQPFNIILVKTYIESIPSSLQEAAEVDGAGTFTVFWKIVLPMCTPILATVAIFSAVGQWNSFQDTLIYMTDSKLYSLQYLLYTYINQASSIANSVKANAANAAMLATATTPTAIRMTVSVIVVLPIMFIYPFFQRFFVKGMMLGAVKG
ncbi:carbohydrate ABC transporter permease [Bifidobacterium cuniculi]|uniref:ABC transporter, permease protein n=1 Tax=Bifidobacterium cuniculi TaxID=1688 RepID=A0A087AZN2_9BIFI|nr:carbohydrate ABC transporter permease [Bifidobacterium cuniculi]KFI64232.1 ABC transporter, permease protein [Bifidobacterium cuniculi]